MNQQKKKQVAAKQHDREAIAACLQSLEDELKALSLWGGELRCPASEILTSPNPFGAGIMEFHEWLEYIFIARFRELLAQESPLPSKMLIQPYAQEYYRGKWFEYRRLIGILHDLDKLINLE